MAITEEPKKLGFGMMRLPRRGVVIDVEKTKQMVDLFMAAGFTYFDTAYAYTGSETATRKALVERYPRESFTIATKLAAGLKPTEKGAKKELETSLERSGAGYIDYYLLHSLMAGNYKLYEKYHLWDFLQEQKAAGRIRHYGFSFHDSPELLDEILTAHPDVEFVQLQINYADWEDPRVASRRNYEVARKHGKRIVIMEPVKGGKLANPPEEVQKLFRQANPDRSFASWAIRFAASLDGVLTVLSGMSTIEQMKDNLSYMTNFEPLNDAERRVLHEAERILGATNTIPCTACRYCTEGCPKQIPIPDVFSATNLLLGSGRREEAEAAYAALPIGRSAADCIACRKCEKVCPQHIEVSERMKETVKLFEQN
ncbi:MAG: aldo/keto reductase [Clostridia bacterium]|nr:aldo/keto reductase [Clostridia bacterium]